VLGLPVWGVLVVCEEGNLIGRVGDERKVEGNFHKSFGKGV